MKATNFFLLVTMSLILSLLPQQLTAGTADVPYAVTLYQQSKPDRDHNQQVDKNGQRTPARPIVVYLSLSEGVSSSYFEPEDVISYSVLCINGESIFSTENSSDFINYITSCQGTIKIQIELVDFNLEGWLQL